MDVLVICNAFTETMPTSQCILSVVDRMNELGHSCRIVTKNGLIYDSVDNYKCLEKGAEVSSSLRNPFKRVIDYFKLYVPDKDIINERIEQLYEKTIAEVSRKRPDVLIASCGGVYTLEVGCRIKQQLNDGIVYVPYFLDALLSGFPLKFMSQKRHDKKNIDLENRLLSNADSIIMMKAAKKKHEYYRDRLCFIDKVKYLDIPLYRPQSNIQNIERANFPNDQVVVFYVGSMPRRVRDPRYFMNLFCAMQNQKVHLYIAGKSAYMDDLKQFAEKDGRIHLLGTIPHEKAVEMQQEADFLLNIGNSLSSMIPSKVFEYMSTGKPIISTYRIDDDPIVAYLNYYQNALNINERNSFSDEAKRLDSFINLKNENNNSLSDKQREKLFDNTPDAVVEYLESLIKKEK